MMERAVFLDRDGVINTMVYNPDYGMVDSPANLEEFEFMPGVAKAISEIKAMGFLVIVVSNQPGIAKGKFTSEILEAVTSKMTRTLAREGAGVDAVYYCLHHPKANVLKYRQVCACRKPSPGLLLRAAQDWNIDLAESFMVGDGITDVAAGQSAGARTFFISPRKCYICDEFVRHEVNPDFVVKDLWEASSVIRQIEQGNAVAVPEWGFLRNDRSSLNNDIGYSLKK
jgi:D-glycero-D-manno-heptose 1,7-bisphosphate phosphatase